VSVSKSQQAGYVIVRPQISKFQSENKMKHKRQHFIPSSYLEAWCDPSSPADQTPYVWRFSKDGREVKNKASKKLFYEKDMYTIYDNDGLRDLHLETNLSNVESEFAKLREKKLKTRQLLNSKDCLILCMFVAAMYGRTKAYGEQQSKNWQKVLAMGEKFHAAFEKASPEEQKRMARALAFPGLDREKIITLEDVKEIVEQPIQSFLSANVTILAPMLFKRPFLILETTVSNSFITSDNPCIWFDPAIYQKPRPPGAGGLISPTLEITMPLSPSQIIFFGMKLIISGRYMLITDQVVDNLNFRTRFGSHKYFVSNNPKARPSWF